MTNKRSIFLLVLMVSLVACKATGPADDEWETRDQNANTGRVFSKDGSAFTVFSNDPKDKGALFNSNKDKAPQQEQAVSGSSNPANEYESYKQWQAAKQADSAEYEKFKKWQEFEDYQRWKEQQKK